MPPVTPSTWKNTRLADHFSPVCPQTVPVTDTGMEALLEMPRGRLAQLRRMKPLLANYSEDCLYLNMYVPREGEFSYFFCVYLSACAHKCTTSTHVGIRNINSCHNKHVKEKKKG